MENKDEAKDEISEIYAKSARSLKASGCPAERLFRAWYPAKSLVCAGYPEAELIEAGYTEDEINKAVAFRDTK